MDLLESPTKLLLKAKSKSQYGELSNDKLQAAAAQLDTKFYGDFLTLTTQRRSKLNEYLHYHQQLQKQQQSSPKYRRGPYANDQPFHHMRAASTGSGLMSADLNSADTLKLDADFNVLHSKLFYQSDGCSGASNNDYVIQQPSSGGPSKKLLFAGGSAVLPPPPQLPQATNGASNIVSPPNQFNDNHLLSSTGKVIKL